MCPLKPLALAADLILGTLSLIMRPYHNYTNSFTNRHTQKKKQQQQQKNQLLLTTTYHISIDLMEAYHFVLFTKVITIFLEVLFSLIYITPC